MMHIRLKASSSLVLLAMVLVACGPTPAAEKTATPTEPAPPATLTQASAPSATAPAAPEEAVPAGEELPASPQSITFEAEDGKTLQGTYYPAEEENASILVLMHWARGWQMDWAPYALWLQNREPLPEGSPLPTLPKGTSFAVLTFDFRGFEGGTQPSSFDADGWLADARAAVEHARSLPGVHPKRLATIGASIGGDGAADACGQGCLGALSLSPGGFLNVPYSDAVDRLSGKPTWCLAAEGDRRSAQSCRSAKSDTYQSIVYEGSAHGMDLFQQELDPPVSEVILDFLAALFEDPVR